MNVYGQSKTTFFFQLSTQSVAQSTFPDARIFKKKSIGEKKTKKKVEYLSMKAIFFIFTFLCRFWLQIDFENGSALALSHESFSEKNRYLPTHPSPTPFPPHWSQIRGHFSVMYFHLSDSFTYIHRATYRFWFLTKSVIKPRWG